MVDNSDKMEPGNKLEVPHRCDRRKKSPSVSASIDGENRIATFAGDQIRRDRRIKSPGVSPALRTYKVRIFYKSYHTFC